MRITPILLFAVGLPLVSTASAAVLLSTDFTDRTISGKTANNVIWTSNGLSAPSTLTAVDEVPVNGAFAALFDSSHAQGHFAPDKNTGNEGPWSTTTTLTVTGATVSLESIDIDWQHFSNTGVFQGPGRAVRWTVTVTGSNSGLLANGTVVGTGDATSGVNNLAFSAPLSLDSSETYDVRFFVDNNGDINGNNTGFDGLTFNGEIVPEPSAVLFLGFGVLGFGVRRHRA